MEGLEIVEIKLSETISAQRIDSEFFKRSYLRIDTLFKEIPTLILRKITPNILHPVEIERVYQNSGIRILLAQNVRDNFIDLSKEVFMSEKVSGILQKNEIDYDDVILTRSGANFGQCACFKLRNVKIYACADVLVIKNGGKFKGGYLSTFLNSWYGRQIIDRGAYGMAQPHIAPNYLKNISIPRFQHLETLIDGLIDKAFEVRNLSERLYRQAETLLLHSLGLADFDFDAGQKVNSNIKPFSASFLKSGRLDAEYYQEKYEVIERKIVTA